jgi:thymidylate synthase (FAD)
MSAKLVAVTQPSSGGGPESLIAYCARVSSDNQDNPDYDKLLKYCIEHGHWSVFETASMTVEINTSRAIAAQILRHRSFQFQEFSQRYQKVKEKGYKQYAARRQHAKNRQSSTDDLPKETKDLFNYAQEKVWNDSYTLYETLLKEGVAKECARMILPLNTSTRLYMTGSARSWIHYLKVRTDETTQLEHRELAEEIRTIFCGQFPITARALGWGGNSGE